MRIATILTTATFLTSDRLLLLSVIKMRPRMLSVVVVGKNSMVSKFGGPSLVRLTGVFQIF